MSKTAAMTVLGITSAAFVGLGLFFVRGDLGTADKYASVGSLFVGICGLALSIIGLRAGRHPDPTDRTSRRNAAYHFENNNGVVVNPRRRVKMIHYHGTTASRSLRGPFRR